MKKVLFTSITSILLLALVSLANAAGNNNGNNNGPTNIDVDNRNTNLNANLNDNDVDVDVDVDVGVNVKPKFYTNIKNYDTNLNINDIDNKDININKVRQGQKQDQDQRQNQNQSQGQSQGNINKVDNADTVTIDDHTIVEDKRDHIAAPGILNADPSFTDSKASQVKALGWEYLDILSKITYTVAKRMTKDGDDFEVYDNLMFENNFRINGIYKLDPSSDPGVPMGMMTFVPDGDDVTVGGLIGLIALKGMQVGATHFQILNKEEIVEAYGSQWNIGISGAASIVGGSDGKDNVAIAPGGGLGFGSARAKNETRPAAIVMYYYNSSMVID
jgi:hypothetical protein